MPDYPSSKSHLKLSKALKDRGINVTDEYEVDNGGLRPYKIDIAIPEKMIAIEVDGDHHLTPEQQKHDANKRNFLTAKGWKVYSVPASDCHGEQLIKKTNYIQHQIRTTSENRTTKRELSNSDHAINEPFGSNQESIDKQKEWGVCKNCHIKVRYDQDLCDNCAQKIYEGIGGDTKSPARKREEDLPPVILNPKHFHPKSKTGDDATITKPPEKQKKTDFILYEAKATITKPPKKQNKTGLILIVILVILILAMIYLFFKKSTVIIDTPMTTNVSLSATQPVPLPQITKNMPLSEVIRLRGAPEKSTIMYNMGTVIFWAEYPDIRAEFVCRGPAGEVQQELEQAKLPENEVYNYFLGRDCTVDRIG